jgi:hypothetical protein
MNNSLEQEKFNKIFSFFLGIFIVLFIYSLIKKNKILII